MLVTLHGPTSFLPVNVTLRLLGDGAEEMNQQLIETTQEIRGKRNIRHRHQIIKFLEFNNIFKLHKRRLKFN